MKIKTTYWENINSAFTTLSQGLRLTLRHLFNSRKQAAPAKISSPGYFDNYKDGLVTVQYPHEIIPVPDNGRYRLHNEIDDCIVCDKCAKICPVDCIDIEPIKSPEVIGYTSDGTPKRIYAAKFDIDMAKCCFCGLCTTVCPTECLTMTKTFDFSEYDVDDHTYAFANLSESEINDKMKVWEFFEKEKSKGAPSEKTATAKAKPAIPPRPILKPMVKPKPKN